MHAHNFGHFACSAEYDSNQARRRKVNCSKQVHFTEQYFPTGVPLT